jgi:peptide/nickel transport system ATP-binding protein
MTAVAPVIDVRTLSVVFDTYDGPAPAVQQVSFHVDRGETLGLVGESGCGKTVTALALMRLLPTTGRVTSGEVHFEGMDLLAADDDTMRTLRGRRIAMAFQEPMTALNPVFTIGSQVTEALRVHRDLRRHDANEQAMRMLHRVGVPDPDRVFDAYPHQLSGGLRQRALIAMSLVCMPAFLIADEPTTAIDVSLQVQILRLINDLKLEFGMGVLLITHDLSVVAESCDRVAVMYASHIVETARVGEIFRMPRHPYTIGLLQSVPAVHAPHQALSIIPGQVPRPQNYPAGCNFASRCTFASEKCLRHDPPLASVSDGHEVACWNIDRVAQLHPGALPRHDAAV